MAANGFIGLSLTLSLFIIFVTGQSWEENKMNVCRKGKKQSPINIDTNKNINFLKSNLRIDLSDFRYPVGESLITNDCYTVKISFNESVQPFIRLISKNYSDFRVKQIHFHWGYSIASGSEHSINGKKLPLESHIVAWNQKYRDFKNASTSRDGILVIAILFNINSKKNRQFDSFRNAIKNVQNTKIYSKDLKLISLLPTSYNASVYSGSLTTPPCTENVFWIVFEKPNIIGQSQLKSFYRIPSCNRGYLGANSREIQLLNGRTVYRNPIIKV